MRAGAEQEEREPAIVADGLTKSYGASVVLDDVSFVVERGSIVGLVGPNGAGKTTTLKSILGLTSFAGNLKVLGVDPRRGRHTIMQDVGFIADVGVLPRWLKVAQAIDYVAGVHPRFDRTRAVDRLRDSGIGLDRRVRQLSKGMVTQLHLALVMSIDVDLLVLDEPTLGLDIVHRKAFYDRLLRDYFDDKRSIIISTHQVEEIEPLLTDVLFIDRGRIVLDLGTNEIAERFAEVSVDASAVDRALAAGPISVRETMAGKSMIFEGVDRALLADLGEIVTPGLADLFVARMS
jgi:ABC-2 type transport system ATP-binding protein